MIILNPLITPIIYYDKSVETISDLSVSKKLGFSLNNIQLVILE